MPPAKTDNEKARATARYVRVAPNKVRQVVAHIRGMDVEGARRLLQFSPKGAAEPVLKTLNSAIANAENNVEPPYDADELVVTSAVVDEGPMLKRFQPRAMGRAYRVRKRTSHITVAVGVPAARGGRGAAGTTVRADAPAGRARSFGRRGSGATVATGVATPGQAARPEPAQPVPAAPADDDSQE
jgi:large subunit ribosomal protein L22